MPVAPFTDVFSKMSNAQMATFKQRLTNLRDKLREAKECTDPREACKKLQKVFGDDFPVPEAKDTARQMAPAIISAGSSA